VLIPVLMEHYPKHYLPGVEVLADAFGVDPLGKSNDELVASCAREVRNLQKQCGVDPVFAQALDEQTAELMFWAVKMDPSGLFYPLPDLTIKECIQCSFR